MKDLCHIIWNINGDTYNLEDTAAPTFFKICGDACVRHQER